MSEGLSDAGHRSWLERLSQALLGEPKDRHGLLAVLEEAQKRKLLDIDTLEMMKGVLEVSEMQVRDVMISRAQMVVVENDWPMERLLAEVMESGHSRFPVIDKSRDNVIGILIVKDLLRFFARSEHFQLQDILRAAHFIPESKRLDLLLKEFRGNRRHMAIVVDEYGGVAGLVTIEDVLEQIVGQIDDEHDVDEEVRFINARGEREYSVRALTPVAVFNEYFGVQLSDEEADTVGGLVMMELDHLPKPGETVDIADRFRFQVLEADDRRLHLLGLVLLGDQTPSADPPPDSWSQTRR